MKKILTFKGFETLNERILIPSDEDKRLKEEVFPRISEILKDKSLWISYGLWIDCTLMGNPIANSIPFIPFKYKMASGEEAEVKFLVSNSSVIKDPAAFFPRTPDNLKDNLIVVNGDSAESLLREEGRYLLTVLKHELIHAKDPGLNQYKYSEKHFPSNRDKYREKYFETKPEGLAFGGQFIERVKDSLDYFLEEGLTEERIKTLNSVLNTLATRTTGSIHPINYSKEVSNFLKYEGAFGRIKNLLSKDPNLDLSPPISKLKAAGNPEFQKFQKKFYQELLKIADKVNLLLSQEYPDIKGRIKISSSL